MLLVRFLLEMMVLLCIIQLQPHTAYRLHQKKIHTCVKAKYSKSSETRGKVGACHSHHWVRPKWIEPHLDTYLCIYLNFKMSIGPVWTNLMVGVAHSLPSICTPSVFSTGIDNNVYFLLVVTVNTPRVPEISDECTFHFWHTGLLVLCVRECRSLKQMPKYNSSGWTEWIIIFN